MTIAQPPGDDAPTPGTADPTLADVSLSDLTTRLERVASMPLAEHPDIYQGIHAELQRALADIDDA